MTGTVTKVQHMKNRQKRSYGFIHGKDCKDYWFSLVGIEEVNIGDLVEFKGERNEKGNVAVHVRSIT